MTVESVSTVESQAVENIWQILDLVDQSGLGTEGVAYMDGVYKGVIDVVAPNNSDLAARARTEHTVANYGRYINGMLIGRLLGQAHNVGSTHPVSEISS